MKNAVAKISMVSAKLATTTTTIAPGYAGSTIQRRSTASTILTASAASAPTKTPTADLALLREATNAAVSPATMLIAAPVAAEIAPCRPAASPATSAMAKVAPSCQRRMMRIGLPKRPKSAFIRSGPGKAAKLYSKIPSAQLREQPVEMLQARLLDEKFSGAFAPGDDLHRGAEPLGGFLLQALQVAVGLAPGAAGGRAQQLAHQRFGLAHGHSTGGDPVGGFHLTGGVEREERPGVPHLQLARHDHLLHRLGELEEPQQVGGRAARAADGLGRLLVRHAEFVEQPLYAGRLLHGIEVLALDVLDEAHGERRLVGHLAHHRGHFGEPGHLRRAPAPFARDELVATAFHGPDQHRLHEPLLADGRGEIGERRLVHPGPRLILSRPDAAHGQRAQCLARGLR